MSDKIDMRISGSSTMPGGDYGKVSISGSGKVQGNLRADSVRCSGSARVQGSVTTEDLRCSGSCALHGDVYAKEVEVSGAMKVEGSLTGEKIKVSGAIKTGRTLRCKKLNVAGGLSVGEDVEAEEANLAGGIKIAGLLNAERIELKSSPSSRIKDIGCSSLKVRKEKGSLLKRILSTDYALEAESIEGDQVDLEYTRADVIRGRDLYIGQGCKVHRAEYTGTCQAEEGTVEELVKV